MKKSVKWMVLLMLVISASSLFPINASAKGSEGQTHAGITYYDDSKVPGDSEKPTQGGGGFLPQAGETSKNWLIAIGFLVSGLALLSIRLLSNKALLDKNKSKQKRKEELS
ncbi:LPXTG cell wall anchor domain-containing protein [Vagococcus elongatus]|uniref:Gram-positive cocci surface proteins LPxTG domain-containing protein n=1 Tax=Vagococcus elongatus TaxID=180344 RepID=A0A430ANN7_9ENTE|nr:LPXTG cell wall anchor domain-containing protein [Vagococcus elongatus]RSU09583.1 hypothetical protein CBF29_11300 [Vagococcus elongatus]